MLQSSPKDDAVHLLKPVLTAKTWVSCKKNGVHASVKDTFSPDRG